MLTPRPILCALLAGAVLAVPAAPAQAARCPLSEREKQRLGVRDGYVNELRVSGTRCRRGKEVVRAFQRCRYDRGANSARCDGRPLGYRCREDREAAAGSYSSTVRCRKGGARVLHRYFQFTGRARAAAPRRR